MGDSVKYWAVIVPPRWRVVESADRPADPAGGYVIEAARCRSAESARRVVRSVSYLIRAMPGAEFGEALEYLREIENHLLHGYGER